MILPESPNCIVILGATATGKTGLGVHLARRFGGEIISADSRQVYRGLDIGSGKDLFEYGDTPHHLIDVATLGEEYNVFSYQRDFYRIFPGILSRGKLPVIVGGTGMYLDAVIRGYRLNAVPENPALRAELDRLGLDELIARLLTLKAEVHNRTDLDDRGRLVRAIEIAEYSRSDAAAGGDVVCSDAGGSDCSVPDREESSSIDSAAVRPDIRPLILGVRFERAELRARIRARLEERIAEGLVEEVIDLHETGTDWERLERLGLECRFTAEFLQGKIPERAEYVERLYRAIGQFAKRQETWFRGMERKGVTINWIENGDRAAAEALAGRYFGTD